MWNISDESIYTRQNMSDDECDACMRSTLGKCLTHRTAMLSRTVQTDARARSIDLTELVDKVDKLEKRMTDVENKLSMIIDTRVGFGAHYVPFSPETPQFSDPRSPRPRSPMKMRRMGSRIVPNVLFNKNDMDVVDGIHPFKGL
jgi:hypothetical protein